MRSATLAPALGGLILAIVTLPGSAAATGVTPSPKQVSGATAAVSSCGSLAGIVLSWTVTANAVTAVTLASIPTACTGAALSLTLVGTGNLSLATAGPVTVTGTTLTLSSLSAAATSTSVVGAYVSVVGP